MIVDIIEYIIEFERIRDNWDGIYNEDPESHPRLSWKWLRDYLSRERRWFVLALRRAPSETQYCAFLPLELTTYLDESNGLFCDEIRLIANHGTGRTGLLCVSGVENEAADAFAALLAGENWARMSLDLDPGSARLDRLLHAFPAKGMKHGRGDCGRVPARPGERMRCMLVRTLNGSDPRGGLNRRSTDFVFERATTFHSRGELDQADAAYRQVIRAVPRHIHARYGLAQLCCDRGEYAEAEHLYRGLLSAIPDADRVLHRLGDTQMAQALYREAGETFENLLCRHPHLGIIRYKLAVCLLASGRKQAAIATFLSFEDIVSDDPDHIRCKARSREAARHLRLLNGNSEPHADRQRPRFGISMEGGSQSPGDIPAARASALTLLTPRWLLKPSLPAGASAHLHASASRYGPAGSRLKH